MRTHGERRWGCQNVSCRCKSKKNPQNVKTWWGWFWEEATERTWIYQYVTKHVGLICINNLASQEKKNKKNPHQDILFNHKRRPVAREKVRGSAEDHSSSSGGHESLFNGFWLKESTSHWRGNGFLRIVLQVLSIRLVAFFFVKKYFKDNDKAK